jgi:hypothetical protein
MVLGVVANFRKSLHFTLDMADAMSIIDSDSKRNRREATMKASKMDKAMKAYDAMLARYRAECDAVRKVDGEQAAKDTWNGMIESVEYKRIKARMLAC